MARVVGASAVVALVDQHDGPVFRPTCREGLPIVRGAEEPVEDDQGRKRGIGQRRSEGAVEQDHAQERGRKASLYCPTAFCKPR